MNNFGVREEGEREARGGQRKKGGERGRVKERWEGGEEEEDRRGR